MNKGKENQRFDCDIFTDKEAIKLLKKAIKAKNQSNYPNIPEYAVPEPRYEDKTANGLTKCIVDFLNNTEGCQAERISSEGRVIDTRKTVTNTVGVIKTIGSIKRVKSSSQVGTADISATMWGQSVKIEVKIGADRQSEAQKLYQASIEKAGGIYLLIKSFGEFFNWYIHFK
ncbi:hypothetical protein [Flectobacillus rivi]|uniref:VRR-NUC domain-containing protein n=1 Tax=Flectobacillus rivi TaxID=2984209 RepID=A0ABT6Z067_9BACT|nr:hypothetical protein [Flectobacillus rivi]MDI9874502.1 hypothetical protein [Flectobacillus rivi]